MNLSILHPTAVLQGHVNITGSKSESNRLLILQNLFPGIEVTNLSNSDDVKAMVAALSHQEQIKDIHHAGTTMRFLTAYYATMEGEKVTLTGSSRMQQRPIGILVDALRQLGASISYTKNEGYPPLHIEGKKITTSKVCLPASVSSQYISALLLIAPRLAMGLEILLEGRITSLPYIKMTLALLEKLGVSVDLNDQSIKVEPLRQAINRQTFVVESDWSSASYYFSMVALAKEAKVHLSSYRKESLQGDAVLIELYRELGVDTTFTKDGIQLEKIKGFTPPDKVAFDLVNCPDLAQTIAVTCAGLGVGCDLRGLHTLKIKETDRLLALKNELTKLGAKLDVTEDSLYLEKNGSLIGNQSIATYQDHRMALAFAPLALRVPIAIEEADVVSKSYPDFWTDLEALDFHCSKM